MTLSQHLARKNVGTVLVFLAAFGACSVAVHAHATVVACIHPVSVPQTEDGVYINVATGGTATSEFQDTGRDIDPFNQNGLEFYWNTSSAHTSAGVASASGKLRALKDGYVVGPASQYIQMGATEPAFHATGDSFLGLLFINENGGTTNYGYVHLETTAPLGFPATIVDCKYDNAGVPITVVNPDVLFPDDFEQG